MLMLTNVRGEISKALAADSIVTKNFCYEKLVKHDPAFPPSDASVGAAKVRQLGRKVEWKRPAVSECLVVSWPHAVCFI